MPLVVGNACVEPLGACEVVAVDDQLVSHTIVFDVSDVGLRSALCKQVC